MIEQLTTEDPHRFKVATVSRLLGLSRSGYYTWAKHHVSARKARDEEIAAVIARLRSEKGAFFHTYGSPRMHAKLRMGCGFAIGRKRVGRIMRERGWADAVKRKVRFRTNPATSEDKVNRNFHVPGPNRLWLGDITEHHTNEGKVYCAVVLDAYSRLAIWWSIGSRMTADLVVDALQMAPPQTADSPRLICGAQKPLTWWKKRVGNDYRQVRDVMPMPCEPR